MQQQVVQEGSLNPANHRNSQVQLLLGTEIKKTLIKYLDDI